MGCRRGQKRRYSRSNRADFKTLFVFFKHNLVGIEKSILSEDAVDTEVRHECTGNGKCFCCCLHTNGDLVFVGLKGLIANALILLWRSGGEIYTKERGELGVENNV